MSATLSIFASLAAAQFALAIVPGPNMALVLAAGNRDRRLGLMTALGIATAALVWAAAGMTGLGATLAGLPGITEALRIACGLYLILLGGVAVVRAFKADASAIGTVDTGSTDAALCRDAAARAFRAGFLTTITHPKAIPFYLAIFAATGADHLDGLECLAAVLLMPLVGLTWNGALALLVATGPLRAGLQRHRRMAEGVAGTAMIGFGAKLITSRG